ncbi:MAG TPA: ribosome maturation factor RimP [Blastocatellia bacterium]|nr:ribosome maturation factor RimP [Blastocatellia bacterium]
MTEKTLVSQVTEIAERVAKDYGLEVVHCELLGDRGAALVRVYIDKPEGVTHEDCANVSNEMSVILDVEDLIPNRYTLEVSSPGLDRGLYKRADYERFAGSMVRIRTAEPIDGRRNYKGRLRGVEGDEVTVVAETGTEAGKEFRFHLSQIAKANLEPEF